MEFFFYDDELPTVEVIKQAADELDYPTYVVGGFVRDRLINRPTKDMDVVCVGDGIREGLTWLQRCPDGSLLQILYPTKGIQ